VNSLEPPCSVEATSPKHGDRAPWLQQFEFQRARWRPRIYFKIRARDFLTRISQKIEKRGDIERVTNR
jgi:hypothetical protein